MKTFLKNIFFFNTMYAPAIISVLYFLNVIVSVGLGLFFCFNDIPKYSMDYRFDVQVSYERHVVLGVVLIIVGPIISRLSAELMMVFFRINEHVTTIANMSNSSKSKNNSL